LAILANVGRPEQFAKQTFAEETEVITRGAVLWHDPPEIGLLKLLKVQGDGLLRVRRGDLLTGLPAPWSEARDCTEILVELKMPGDHIDIPAAERAVLRQQALRVQRVEERPRGPWPRAEPLWLATPNVPQWVRQERSLRPVGAGCYTVEPSWGRFLWIAANKLPLREELVPFLVARSGRALDEFARWVAPRRSPEWVLDMVEYTSMSTKVTEELLRRRFRRVDDPKIQARRRTILRVLLEVAGPKETAQLLDDLPKVKEQLIEQGVKKGIEQGVKKGIEQGVKKGIEQGVKKGIEQGVKKGIEQGRLSEARSALRRVLARRKLPLTAAQEAQIERCEEAATLERWLDQAITAGTAVEALRQPRAKPRRPRSEARPRAR
jgi:flagellar biosynthesis/type III secretory pathway protein FliH